jgi:hypothetical protein
MGIIPVKVGMIGIEPMKYLLICTALIFYIVEKIANSVGGTLFSIAFISGYTLLCVRLPNILPPEHFIQCLSCLLPLIRVQPIPHLCQVKKYLISAPSTIILIKLRKIAKTVTRLYKSPVRIARIDSAWLPIEIAFQSLAF